MGSSTYKAITNYVQHDSNPFMPDAIDNLQVRRRTQMMYPAGDKTVHHIHKVIDTETGEIRDAYSAFIRSITVDEDQFVKVFVRELRALWDLSKPAMRVLTHIMSCMKANQDEIIFDIEECMEYTRYKSERSIFYGLAELIENGIIARSTKTYRYYINPMIVFNGDRVTFARTYVKKRNKERDDKTLDMFEELKQLEAPSDE